MSSIIDHKSFLGSNVVLLNRADQAQMDLALRLMLSGMMPPKISPRGATIGDIAERKQHFQLVTKAFRDYAAALFAELNENLEIGTTIPTADYFEAWDDMMNDILWAMENRADRDHGNVWK